jgi:hypothetical protein
VLELEDRLDNVWDLVEEPAEEAVHDVADAWRRDLPIERVGEPQGFMQGHFVHRGPVGTNVDELASQALPLLDLIRVNSRFPSAFVE